MHSAERTRHNLRIGISAAATYFAAVGVLAWVLPSSNSLGASIVKWVIGIPVGLVSYGLLEWGGGKLVSLPVWSRMP